MHRDFGADMPVTLVVPEKDERRRPAASVTAMATPLPMAARENIPTDVDRAPQGAESPDISGRIPRNRSQTVRRGMAEGRTIQELTMQS